MGQNCMKLQNQHFGGKTVEGHVGQVVGGFPPVPPPTRGNPVITFKYLKKLKFDYPKNKKSFHSEIKSIFPYFISALY